MKRTLDNCRLAKRHGAPNQRGGLCDGLSKSEHDDEPCETCKRCALNTYYADGED